VDELLQEGGPEGGGLHGLQGGMAGGLHQPAGAGVD